MTCAYKTVRARISGSPYVFSPLERTILHYCHELVTNCSSEPRRLGTTSKHWESPLSLFGSKRIDRQRQGAHGARSILAVPISKLLGSVRLTSTSQPAATSWSTTCVVVLPTHGREKSFPIRIWLEIANPNQGEDFLPVAGRFEQPKRLCELGAFEF